VSKKRKKKGESYSKRVEKPCIEVKREKLKKRAAFLVGRRGQRGLEKGEQNHIFGKM